MVSYQINVFSFVLKYFRGSTKASKPPDGNSWEIKIDGSC
jgi:hypothetical protein